MSRIVYTHSPTLRHFAGLVALGVGSLMACGKTSTLGDEKTSAGGQAGTGGVMPDGGGADAGTGGSGANAGIGQADGNVVPAYDAGDCEAPIVAQPAPTTAEEIQRHELVDAVCALNQTYECLRPDWGYVAQLAAECSPEQQVDACKTDLAIRYRGIEQGCFPEWAAALSCMIEHATCPCAPCCDVGPPGSYGTGCPCQTENKAYSECNFAARTKGTVTGTRGPCDYSLSAMGDSCTVYCKREGDAADPSYGGRCEGQGLPFECDCWLSGDGLFGPIAEEDDGTRSLIYARDCEHAAQLLADGACIERLDCCFTWLDAQDPSTEWCSCTSDPQKFGHATCEAAATANGGKVVDLCPVYIRPSSNTPPN